MSAFKMAEILKKVNEVESWLGPSDKDAVYFVSNVLSGKAEYEGFVHVLQELKNKLAGGKDAVLFLAVILKAVRCINQAYDLKPEMKNDESVDFESFVDGECMSEEDARRMKLRSFFICLCKRLGEDRFRKFRECLCFLNEVNPDNFSKPHEICKYIEETSETTDEVMQWILYTLTVNETFKSEQKFAKDFAKKEYPILLDQDMIMARPETQVHHNHQRIGNILPESSKTLRNVYIAMPDIPTQDFFSPWPKIDRTRYVTLALVSSYGMLHDDDFTHRTLRKSEDDIPKHKYSVEYSEVFPRDIQPFNSLVLISGRPGAGKTVLLMKITKDWAKGECLTNVKILFHVSLRELANKNDHPDINDVLDDFFTNKDEIRNIAAAIESVDGEGVCFALDGLDEYPNRSCSSDFVMQLIMKRKFPLALVIVTSRPNASDQVPTPLRQKHVEIVGFMPEQIKEYINDYYEARGQVSKAQDLIDYLDVHPNIKDMCYLPLHLAMILYINQFRRSDPLPETETEVYLRFVSHSVIRYIKRDKKDEEYVYIRHFGDMEEFLSENELKLFNSICMIAFEMRAASQLIFDDSVLKDKFHFKRDERIQFKDNGLGILTNCVKKVAEGQMPQFSFQHLTIQEFLGAHYLTQLDDPSPYISKYGNSNDMRDLWKFFIGLSKSINSFLEYYNTLVLLNPSTGSDTLFLLHCLFEAQGGTFVVEGCDALLDSRNGTINVSNIVLNLSDCSAVAYVISQSPQKLKQLLMNYCQIGPEGIIAIKNQITKSSDFIEFSNIWNMQIRSQINPLGDIGGTHLAEILKCMTKLCELRLYGNRLTYAQLHPLQPIISSMANLRILVLTRNGLGPESGKTIGLILRNLSHLKQFYLSYNPIGTEGLKELLPGLLHCKILERLGFRDCNLTGDEAGKHLSTVITQLQCLQQLELYLNHLGDDGIANMIDSLKATRSLQQLSVTKNDITDVGGCLLSEVVKFNKASLKQIRLYYNELTYKTRMAFSDAAKLRMKQGYSELLYAI